MKDNLMYRRFSTKEPEKIILQLIVPKILEDLFYLMLTGLFQVVISAQRRLQRGSAPTTIDQEYTSTRDVIAVRVTNVSARYPTTRFQTYQLVQRPRLTSHSTPALSKEIIAGMMITRRLTRSSTSRMMSRSQQAHWTKLQQLSSLLTKK